MIFGTSTENIYWPSRRYSPSQPLLGSSRNAPPQLVSCGGGGVTQRSSPTSWGGALRDDPNNGCEGDYRDDYTVETT